MRNSLGISFITLFSVLILVIPNSAFAEQVTVSIPQGTSVQGCEQTDQCYIPNRVTIHPGDEVVWTNDDTAVHTVTSGSAESGPDGAFDSGLIIAGESYSETFRTLGEYPYFCIVHPWMTGSVFVTVGGGMEVGMGTISVGEGDPEKTTVAAMSPDGKVRVELVSSNPADGKQMTIDVSFRDFSGGGLIKNANYDITATQNGKTVLSVVDAHEADGKATHMTSALESADPIDIAVTINGFGLPGDQSNWQGPRGQTITFNVVPEFGVIAILALAFAMSAMIISKRVPVFGRF